MYRFTNQLSNSSSKLVLVRRPFGDGTCAALIVMRAPRRQYGSTDNKDKVCQSPAPPKSNKLYWGTVGVTLLAGAAVVYAKHSPDARNWLESNIPWANDFVALVYQENTTYWKAAVNQFNRTSTYLSHFMFGREGVTPIELTPRSDQDIEKDAEVAFARKDYELPPVILEPLYVEEKVMQTPEIEDTNQATLVQTDKCVPQSAPVVNVTKDIVTLEKDMHEYTKLAIDSYKAATKLCISYNKTLHKIAEASYSDLDKNLFSTLKGFLTERDVTLKKAREGSAKAKSAIDTLDSMIKQGIQAPPQSLTTTKRYIKQLRTDLLSAENIFNEELEKCVLSEKYWNKVEEGRNQFKAELQALYPGIDLSARKLDIKTDIDILLMYALKRMQHLQHQIAELQTVRDLKINRAIECRDEQAIIEAKAEDIVRTERMTQEVEFMKKTLIIQAEANRRTKEELKKQCAIQQAVLADALAKKELEVMSNFNRVVSEKVEAERVVFKKELAAMAGKLQAIEQTLKQRAAAEAEARRSQSLWAAAEALLAATRRPQHDAKLDNELRALEKAGKDDKLVESVLKGIPQEVREKGIATEKSLRERFEKMEKTAVKVALIGREGATLPIYFMSWIQSLLLFTKINAIPEDELANKPIDFTKLDTFDIMQRARYYMDHGDLPAALRYVNLLQGAPRAAAARWVGAARHHLEVRQAAEAVMAHASVSGLLYL